jgi:AcrR family transcriptional regulator
MVQKEPASSPARRGRPRSFDPDAVLDKARAVFWNLGYAATSLDDLSAATGLNRPSLYGAFGDKHAIYMAALQRSRREGLTALAGGLAIEAPLRQVLDVIFARTAELYQAGDQGQRGCFLVGTAVTQAVDDPDVRELVAGFVAETDRLFRERFERSPGELAPGVDPATAAVLASGTFHTLAVRARTGASDAALKAVGQAATTLICGNRR